MEIQLRSFITFQMKVYSRIGDGWLGGEAAWPESAALGVAVGGVGKNHHGPETVSLLLNKAPTSIWCQSYKTHYRVSGCAKLLKITDSYW